MHSPLESCAALRGRPHGPALTRVLQAALDAVEPSRLLERAVSVSPDALRIGGHALPLTPEAGVWLVAVGKAAPAMALAMRTRIPGHRLRGGAVVTKHRPATEDELAAAGLPVLQGAHPVPDRRSEAAGRAVLDVVARAQPQDVVVLLLSGGASSLMVAPAPGSTLDDLRAVSEALLRSGAPIEELNVVRKALDSLKGGGLLRRAAPARVATVVLSDVVDAPLHVVGSGPTLPDPSGRAEAAAVLAARGIEAPPAVRRWLARPDDPTPAPAPTEHNPVVELASNATAVEAAVAAARAEGWPVERQPTLRGEARDQGRALASRLRALQPSVPTALVAGGETTVTLRGPAAGRRGGRNQELALAALLELQGAVGTTLVALATDGEDGPTDAAGAVVDGGSAARARALGLDPARHLHEHDAYPVFEALGDLLRIGPTGTNVCDLVLALARP